MRPLQLVVSRMIPLIPESETSLRNALHSIAESAVYAAPEMLSTWWSEAAATLNFHVGEHITEPWQQDVADIFAGRK